MNAFKVLAVFVAALFGATLAHAAPGPQVIGWVPPYAMEESMRALEANPAVGRALTRMGLQLWNPSADGRGLVFAPVDATGRQVTSADVVRFRDWARARGIRVLLTVYNNSQVLGRWDWALARRAFVDGRADFIRALVAEMDKYQLDGIDLDLEGEGALDADRVAYAAFVRDLSRVLKPRRKLLTVDSFHSPCANAPNMSWWRDWKGQVDAIHSMGYADLYEGSTDTFTPPGGAPCAGGAQLFKYSWQLRHGLQAGYRADQIVMGLPTWVDTWGKDGLGADAPAHLAEVRALGAGVGLWDLQLAAAGWAREDTWAAVKALRTRPGTGWRRLLAR
jgi:hypothetical protein